MIFEVKGLVLRSVDLRESDRLITVFTEEKGIITALAKGARSLKSRKMSSTSQFCYSTIVLYSQGDKYFVKEASLIESFFDLRKSIDSLALAGYIVEVLNHVGTEEGDKQLLRLALNSLYAISTEKCELDKIKSAFEIRLSSMLGFMPDVLACHNCGRKDGQFFFDIMAGAIECYNCHEKMANQHETLSEEHEFSIICILPEGAKIALGYCIYCPLEKLFSFNISDEDMKLFTKATETYLLNHLERGFKSLDFYKEVKR